jgi:Spy/CpxP family protein refolding chaperone
MNTKIFIAGALVVCTALATAQAGQGGQGGRQGRRGGMQGMLGQVNRGGSEMQLVFRKDVQTDLGITPEQKAKLDALQAKQREVRGVRGGNRGTGTGTVGGAGTTGGTGTTGGAGTGGQGRVRGGQGQNMTEAEREAMRKRQQEQREQSRKELSAIINESQMKRLGEIRFQLQGTRALFNEEYQKSLNLTSDQILKINDLQEKQRVANQSLMQKVRNQEISQEDARKSFENNGKVLETEMLKVLTADQSAKYKDMGGKPFKADPPQRGGGGR